MAACVGSFGCKGQQKEPERMRKAWGDSREQENSSVVSQGANGTRAGKCTKHWDPMRNGGLGKRRSDLSVCLHGDGREDTELGRSGEEWALPI